ncbi:hypothetical protein P280DRAFT_251629 [Massarina eburnea CBS 473.64]|uniref:Uncharacterized protein n=1 Tax=Massarina eburnea CBS 473.64 TaxID=1395130 RepID=A0A6A6S6M6_9PLEO|nr:hypothetical protein P280DRAFT_251629 [Massarina eburnea CBS 473.64]
MSGPFRFNQEQTLSPLERRNQSPAPDGVSYKTNINRMKTRKWVEAKKNAYDGDDWGDYDEYNEYGAEAEQPQPQPQPAILPGRFEQPSRSFTDPRQARGPAQPGRRNSFDRGDEHRAFSASMAQPPQQYAQQPYGAPRQPPEQIHPAYRQPSAAESDTSDTPQHRRDFNPTALPPPLHTRVAGGDVTSSPSDSYFPPRKSSIGQAESPTATTPRGRAPSNTDKALPFVRPADIYKRYEEDKQRASMDSSRPSMDSLDASAAPPQAPDGPEAGKSLQPLETVAERRSEYLPDLNISTQVSTQAQDKPFLPPVEGIEGISNFAPLTLPDDENFRSVVDQAFTRKDEQRSVPPTPISKSDSSVSRSNTGSTVGISPIMSRVPSGATSALKARNQAGGDTSTPMIVEEASDTGTPVSRPTSANILGATHQIPRKPSPSHSRNHSNTSIPRSGLATPTSVGSPARSPAIEPQKHVPEPETAQLAALSPTSDTATREADIASAMNKNPDLPASQFGVAEKDSQMAFLESHHAQSAVDDALPRSRPESPSKGRVQELAGKFGDVSHSRRGSVQSNASKTSQQSWERSQDNSRPSSPTKASGTTKDTPAARPATEREVSFRPKLPGQWESYATSAATPSEHDQEFGEDSSQTVEDNVSSPLEDVDITPTTEKQLVSVAEPSTADPLMALKAAGTAVAESFQSSVGGGSSQEEPQRNLAHGNVLPRPLQVERTSSSVSTIPPTPPAKDTPEFEDLPPPPPLKPNDQSRRTSAAYTNERPAFVPQLSTDPSAEDQESDRLRKEIVASLTPQRTFATPVVEANAASLQPTDPFPSHENSINPSESQSEHLKTTTEPTGATSLLDRFSWEAHGSNPQGQAQSGTATQSSRGIANEVKLPSPAVEQAAKDHPNESFESVSHSTAVDAEAGVHTPTPPDSARRLGSPVLSSPGLHVVNSADHPEAVEMPLRLSTQVPPISDLPHSSDEKPAVIGDPETPKVTTQAPPLTTTITAAQSPITKSPASDKPLGFRDIINMKSSSERINTYNQTRKYWAHTDHGLGAWVSSAVSANPELATDPYSQPRPVLSSSTTSRHRPTASISLFGKHHGSQQAGPSGAASSQAPSTPASAPTYTGPTRSASHQVQSKGKDLLHTAGLLSGKGMTGAKGLFAKGKSRFGKSDKVDK